MSQSRMDRGRKFYLQLYSWGGGWSRESIAKKVDSRIFPWFIRDFQKFRVILIMDPDLIHQHARGPHGEA